MIASIISSVKLLPWRSPHRKSKTEARAGPDRVATLGDAWMRCRSISYARWITYQNPTSLRSPSDKSTPSAIISSGFTIFS
jgi:hypothetical protein